MDISEGFSDVELHCIARMLQSAAFANEGIFTGCVFCKYPCGNNKTDTYERVMHKLYILTGVDTRVGRTKGIAPNDFSYRRFLLSSNDKIKADIAEHFRGFL